jgi:hypothetical protein
VVGRSGITATPVVREFDNTITGSNVSYNGSAATGSSRAETSVSTDRVENAKMEPVSFIKSHPFWTLLIGVLVLSVLSYVAFGFGHGSGGFDVGPIQPDR